MISAFGTLKCCGTERVQVRLFLLFLLLLSGCSSSFERKVQTFPAGSYDLAADRALCREYAVRYGVINLGPMLGDKVKNQPDRQRRNRLFILCMQEKGYRF